ncbi:hypothetical protein I3760_02G074500, partial [Carya illinoinensis]
ISKKSLNSAFTSLSEDVTDSLKEPVDLFSVFEIADSDQFREISGSFLMAANPALSASSESLFASDLTPSSKVTAEMDEPGHQIMDALIEIVIGEFYPHPEEKDHFGKLILMKIQIVLLCFFLWILAVVVAFFFGSAVQNTFRGSLPT